jgi:hypothetical protein
MVAACGHRDRYQNGVPAMDGLQIRACTDQSALDLVQDGLCCDTGSHRRIPFWSTPRLHVHTKLPSTVPTLADLNIPRASRFFFTSPERVRTGPKWAGCARFQS